LNRIGIWPDGGLPKFIAGIFMVPPVLGVVVAGAVVAAGAGLIAGAVVSAGAGLVIVPVSAGDGAGDSVA